MFQQIPLNITGVTFQSRSKELSAQQNLNLYQELNPGGEEEYVLMPFPGYTFNTSQTGTLDRGLHVMNNNLYRVLDQTFYRVSGGIHFAAGEIPGTNRCIFANDGNKIYIVTAGNVYEYDKNPLVETVTEVTDSNINGAISVDFINNQFIYTKANTSVISVVGDGSTASSLDTIGAESSPDGLVRDFVFNEEILRFGAKTLERWYNSGVGNPPIQRQQGQTQQVGLGAQHSVVKTDNFYYFISDDRKVFQGQTGIAVDITSRGVANFLESLTDISDAIGMTCTFQGQNFYIFTVGGKTFGLNESLGVNGWFSLSGISPNNAYPATSMVYLQGRNYLCVNGGIYTLDINSALHGTDLVERRRVIQYINSELLGKRGERLQMNKFELFAEVGSGVLQGDETDPVIRIETSQDGGSTWTIEKDLKIGRLDGDYIRGEWFSNKTFYSLLIRIIFEEPVLIYLRSASIELRLAGR